MTDFKHGVDDLDLHFIDARTGVGDTGTGPLGVIGNIIWFVLAGWWLAIGNVVTGVLMCLTIIGIPLGLANFKLIPVSLTPFGREIVDSDQPGVVRL